MKRKKGDSQLHIAILLLVVVTIAAYLPVWHADYVNFDDELYVKINPVVQAGLTIEGLKWAFNVGYEGNWTPVTWISHMAVRQAFGPGPMGPHAVNLLLHVANILFLLLVLRRMTKSLWRSVFVAALFAVHPIHVESVAWIAERKDVLSMFFWLLTMLAYMHYTEKRSLARYSAVAVLFALGLMSKPTLVTLPLVLLLLDYWPLCRWSRQWWLLVWEKSSLFLMSAVSCVITFLAQQKGDAVRAVTELSLYDRIGNALTAYIEYIIKLIWPLRLAVFYPRPESIALWQIVASFLILVVVTVTAVRTARSRSYLVVGWVWYLLVMLPMIGLVQVGEHAMADRFAYVPFIGLYVIIAWSVSDALSRRFDFRVVSVLVVLVLAGLTYRQTGYWQNSTTLWTHALAISKSSIAHYSLGNAYKDSGNYPDAVEQYQQAIRMKPDYAKAHNNLGISYFELGQAADAVREYSQAVRIKPDYADAYFNLGVAYYDLGKDVDALKAYQRAAELKPSDVGTTLNLAAVYSRVGRDEDAVNEYRRAIRLHTNNADLYFGLGNALGKLGMYMKAVDAYAKATSINPDHANAYYNLADAYCKLGRFDKAVDAYKQVIRINPGDAEAHLFLGAVYWKTGNKALAQQEYEVLTQLAPPLAAKLLQLIGR